MSTTHAALVIGLCSHGLAVARALSREGVTVFAVEQNLNLPGTKTNAVQEIFPVASFSAEDLVPALLDIRQKLQHWQQLVLMPTNDNHVRIVGQALQQLVPPFLLSWVDCAEHILLLQQKDYLEAASHRQQLNYPRSVVFNTTDHIADSIGNMLFPLILKPVKPMSSFKTLIARDSEQLSAFLQQYRHDLPIVAQEYIDGDDKTLFFAEMLLDKGKVIQNVTGRKLASHPPARGQATIAEITPNPEVARLAEQFVAPYQLSGPVALELKKAPDGSFWVIEPTVGRTEFLVELIIAAGYNQPYQEYLIALGQPAPAYHNITPTVWFDTERAPLNYLKSSWSEKSFHPYGKKPAFTYFSLKDIRPFFSACAVLIKRVLFRS